MHIARIAALSVLAAVSAACTTTASFAPPVVKETDQAKVDSLDGGLAFVSLYIDEYRKSGARLANGRQWFDVPSLVAAVGGATAVALGANADVAIGVGAVGALATSGKTYYAPNERADAYFDAVEAFSCIRQETIGLGGKSEAAQVVLNALKGKTDADALALGNDEAGKAKRAELDSASKTLAEFGNLVIDNNRRAGLLLKNSVLSVENKTRVRLSEKGSIADAASISALVMMYQKQIDDAKKKPEAEDVKLLSASGLSSLSAADFVINLEELAPKLAQCTLLANG